MPLSLEIIQSVNCKCSVIYDDKVSATPRVPGFELQEQCVMKTLGNVDIQPSNISIRSQSPSESNALTCPDNKTIL